MPHLQRFRAMVDQIKAHPLLEVRRFEIGAPIDADGLRAVERHLGAPLAPALKGFFQECNGLSLYWKIKAGLSDDEMDALGEDFGDYDLGSPDDESGEDHQSLFANLKILPLQEAIIGRDWSKVILAGDDEMARQPVDFLGKPQPRGTLLQKLRPFDLFSGYACMAFYLEPGVGDPKALHLSGHYVEWDNSRLTDFASYLEVVLATRGLTEARANVFKAYRGDQQPLLTFAGPDDLEHHIPALFQGESAQTDDED